MKLLLVEFNDVDLGDKISLDHDWLLQNENVAKNFVVGFDT